MRDEELPELDTLVREACPYEVKGGSENKQGKANVLLQVGGWMGRVLIAGLLYRHASAWARVPYPSRGTCSLP